MANPNLLSISTVVGKTAVANVTTVASSFIQNDADSGKVFKLNSLIVSNIDGAAAAEISVDIFRSSTPYYIIRTASVPADASIDLLSKTLYLQEGDSIRALASANGDLQIVCSYEEVS